jgi:predicted O-methyltransferase YrrM
MNTHSRDAWKVAKENGPLYDFLFIDAGHSYEDVSLDYGHYQLLVRSGGVIAFHDALERDGYPEVKVHEFLKGHPDWPITVFGNEIGTAVMVKT